MTTIAAAITGGTVTLAADTVALDSAGYALPGARKVWVQPDTARRVVFAACGNSGISTVIERHLKLNYDNLPAGTDDDDRWDSWACAVGMACAGVCAGTTPPVLEDNSVDGNLILGAGGRFWALATHAVIPVYRAVNHYAAGSGKPFALGWLDARPGDLDGAIRCAARWDDGTALDARGPLFVSAKTA